jgi:hypothetical protein
MHQKDLARQAWRDAGLYRSRDQKMRAFLEHFDDSPPDCWADVVETVRGDYPDLKAKLATPLWNTGDKVLRLNILRHADPTLPDELALLKKFTTKLDPDGDAPEIHTIARSDNPELLGRLARKRGLPAGLAATIEARRDALTARHQGADVG